MNRSSLQPWRPALVLGLALAWYGAASEFDPLAELHAQAQVLCAAHTAMPPQADGRIAAGEWDGAAAVAGFYLYATGDVLDAGPVLFLAYDTTALYLLILTPLPEGYTLVAREKARDGKVFQDDSVEVFLRTPKQDLFQVIVNSLGTLSDLKNGSSAWNGQFTVAAGEVAGAALPAEWGLAGQSRWWLVEAALPVRELGADLQTAPTGWSANFAVNRPQPWAVYAPTIGTPFAETSRFCPLTFAAPGTPRLQLTSLGSPGTGNVALHGRASNPGTTPVSLLLDLDLRQQGSTVTQDAYRNVIGVIHAASRSLAVGPGRATPIEMTCTVPDTRVDRLALRVAVAGPDGKPAAPLLLRNGHLTIQPPLVVKAGNVPSRKCLVLEIDAKVLRAKADLALLQYRIEVLGTDGAVLLTQTASAGTAATAVAVDYGQLPVGSYRCRVTAVSGQTALAVTEAAFSRPADPVWLTNRIYDDYGQTDRVPRPWTPLRYGRREVAAWGRTLRWTNASILPASITSQGTELLHQPMRVVLTVDGKDYAVPLGRLDFTSRQPHRGALTATGHARGVTVTAEMAIEYDGFLWVTLRPTDTKPDRQIEALRVQVALAPQSARLYQTFCRPLTGAIGTAPIRMPWLADAAGNIVNFYHWFGDEDKGLGFTYTSLQHWRPRTEEDFATLLSEGESRTYRINLAEGPVSLTGRSYQFGVQATPIKPLPPDYHSMLSTSLNYNAWTAWQHLPENLDTTVVWPPPRMKGLNDPYNTDPKPMAEVVKYAHDRGVAVLFTGCPQKISAFSQEFADYRLEWQTLPDSILNWENTPHYQNCGRSYTLRKWLFYGWAVEIVKRFGFDGIYFDGWQTGQIACSNPHHGCGWADETGRRHLTVPVLEGREFSQRLLLFLEDNVQARLPATAPARPGFPAYHYRIHSWEFVPSVMGFGTSWLTGEFTGYPLSGPSMLAADGTFGKCMGLGLLRTRCLSTNWGVPNFFHVMMWEHTENHPTDRQTLMAYAWLLPHGVPLGELVYMNQKTVLEIARLMMRFGTRRARFIPAWRPNPYLVIEQPAREDLVATWDHAAEGRVLAVVSNLHVDQTHALVLRWTGFRGATVRDARTDETVALADGRLTLSLGPESFRLLRIER